MFNYIEGRVVDKQDGYIVLDCNGVGYEILVSDFTFNATEFPNESVKILTYMQIKEDGISLYGFYTKEEKKMFLKLISVNGIGPKMAMGILSSISVNDLCFAIIKQDIKMLCTVKGLGKKTAERLLVELKDQTMPTVQNSDQQEVNNDYVAQATDALISLGVGKNEAYRLAKQNAADSTSVEEIITKVLRGMGS